MNERMERGQTIAENMEIKQASETLWIVPSQSGNGSYEVSTNYIGYECSCPDYQYRHEKVGDCKHIFALKYYLALKEKVQEDVIDQAMPSDIILCRYCNSPNVVRNGKRGKRVIKQTYRCKDCESYFVPKDEFEKLKTDPRIISMTLSMYYRNMSLRAISQTLASYGLQVSHQTIHNWIARYSELLTNYVMQLQPKFSGKMNVDELYVKVKGEMKYLFNALDPDTRYLLASVLSQHKDVNGAREVFRATKKVIKNQHVKTVTTDGLQGYHVAFKREFVNTDAKHIAGVRLSGATNNNIVERLNGTKRDREKNFRGLKSDSPILKLQDIFYNFIREHEAIGMTPAQCAGIGFGLGKDKWLGLIRKAQRKEEKDIQENKRLQQLKDEWKKKGWD